MLIKVTTTFSDLQHKGILRNKGEVLDVSETRGKELIAKGFAEVLKILKVEDPIKEPTVSELKAELDAKGIKYDAKSKKADLVKLLEGVE